MLRCFGEITSRCVGLSNSSDSAANCCRRSSIAALGRILAQEVFLRTLKYPQTYRDDGGFGMGDTMAIPVHDAEVELRLGGHDGTRLRNPPYC